MCRIAKIIAAGLLLLPWTLTHASAQDSAATFPYRTVKLIVPFPPGGPTDLMARLYAEGMGKIWGQTVVVENRPGADSAIAAQQVAKAAPDGYTLMVAMDVTMVMNPITSTSLSYDPLKDFALISMAAHNTSLLMVRADGPKTVQELIAKAKANPGKLNYGGGIITTRLAGYFFTKAAGIDAVEIPYKGSSEVVQGLLSGSIDFSVDGVSANLSQITGGKLRALAKFNNRPLTPLPDLKHIAIEANLPEIGEISTWAGIVAPTGTQPAIVEKVRQTVTKIASDRQVSDRLIQVGIVATSSTPQEFLDFVKSEQARWSKVYKESGIKPN